MDPHLVAVNLMAWLTRATKIGLALEDAGHVFINAVWPPSPESGLKSAMPVVQLTGEQASELSRYVDAAKSGKAGS